MAKKTDALTTRQFAELTGLPVDTVTKMVRLGKIKGAKQSGRWMIAKSQLKSKAVLSLTGSAPQAAASGTGTKPKKKPSQAKAAKPSAAPSSAKPSAKSYSVSEFVELTFLTEHGVLQWLKSGRLSGRQDDNGTWLVDAVNLEKPGIKHLVR